MLPELQAKIVEKKKAAPRPNSDAVFKQLVNKTYAISPLKKSAETTASITEEQGK